MSDDAPVLRLALDQNFPTPLIRSIAEFLPIDIELKHLNEIDRRLSSLDDRPLFLVLQHLGWHGLITNDYKMLDVPAELLAIIRTQAVVVAIEGLGDDPLRAAGALLLELPGLTGRVVPRRSNVFRIAYGRRSSQNARDILTRVAERQKTTADEQWDRFAVTVEEYDEARAIAGMSIKRPT